jgi:ATP-dependent RNA helicase SUPV3L1/SUV3
LWRPARFDRQGHRRHDQRPRHGRGPAEAGAETAERPSRPDRQRGRPPFQGRREGEGAERPAGKPKFDRDRYKGPPKPQGEAGRPDFRKGKPQGDRPERGPKPAFQARPQREERPAKVDPLSPFAKLAALRDQLQPKK